MTTPSNAPAKKEAAHLRYLDGLRGLAALYVVLFHCQMHLRLHTGEPAFPAAISFLLQFLTYGHSAVCVFIVLSGYVLMLPIVRSPDNQLKGGISYFFKRRAKRILPTYYAALLLFSGLLLVVRHLPLGEGHSSHALSGISFIEHVFLVHNLDYDHWFDIDGPMWSLATECQIYVLFALVLLPLYHRFGLWGAFFFSLVVSLSPHFLLPAPRNMDQASPWFLTLFVLGMMAAAINFSTDPTSRVGRQRVPWGIVAAVIYGLFALFLFSWLPSALQTFLEQNAWLPDMVCGAATAALLIHCTNVLQKTPKNQSPSPFVRLLQSRFLVGIGAFSYSLYLIHQPIVGLLVEAMQWKRLHLSTGSIWGFSFAALPLVVGLGYLFYLLFERPFIGNAAYRLPTFFSRPAPAKPQTDPNIEFTF